MAYGLKTKGGNKTLNPHARDEWMKGKKFGCPRQIWIWDIEPCDDKVSKYNGPGIGHWEKAAK